MRFPPFLMALLLLRKNLLLHTLPASRMFKYRHLLRRSLSLRQLLSFQPLADRFLRVLNQHRKQQTKGCRFLTAGIPGMNAPHDNNSSDKTESFWISIALHNLSGSLCVILFAFVHIRSYFLDTMLWTGNYQSKELTNIQCHELSRSSVDATAPLDAQ